MYYTFELAIHSYTILHLHYHYVSLSQIESWKQDDTMQEDGHLFYYRPPTERTPLELPKPMDGHGDDESMAMNFPVNVDEDDTDKFMFVHQNKHQRYLLNR